MGDDASGTWRVQGRKKAEQSGLRTRLVAAACGALVIAAGVGTSVLVHRYAARRAAGASGWHGRVARIVKSGPSSASGLLVSGTTGDVEAREGGDLPAGAHLATDPTTRARLTLDDGSELVLDRATQVALLPGERSLRLLAGQIALDVVPVTFAGKPGNALAQVVTSDGETTASDAKLVVTSASDRTSVEVVRGSAELRTAAGSAEVRVGEEAVADAEKAPLVTAIPDLARRVAFSEKVGAGERGLGAQASAYSGLGELVARRPGRADEKERALHLSTHSATIRIAANVARTELTEEFTNDTGDDLEGVYRFPLPAGAQIERLALDVGGKMVDGAFVDKAKAAAIWRGAIQNATPKAPKPQEDIVWVPGPWHDPALLEWNGGGRFELRIFPIPRHGSRRIQLAYTETVPAVAGERHYVYPLPERSRGTPPIDRFALDVQVRGADPVRAVGYDLLRGLGEANVQHLSLRAESFVPTGDLTLDYSLPGDRMSDMTAWAYEDPARPGEDPFVALAMRPRLPRWEHASWRDQVLVVDSGRAMTGERFRQASRLAAEMAEQMDRRDRLTVLACDLACKRLPEGWVSPGATAAQSVQAFLGAYEPDGATDLVGAVRSAAALPGRSLAHDLRVVLVSSGFGGSGYRSPDKVSREVAAALEDPRAEVVAVAIGGDADQTLLGEVARGGGGTLLSYPPGETPATMALNVLGATYGATLRDATLVLPDGFYGGPMALAPLVAGAEQIVTLRMHGARQQGEAILRGKVGGQPFEVKYPIDLRASNEPGNAFVPRLWAKARVAELERAAPEAARTELVQISQRFSVPSRNTSLLVLESEAMFSAFGIDRTKDATSFTGESDALAAFSAAPNAEKDEYAKAATPGKAARMSPLDLSVDDSIGFGRVGGGGGEARADERAAKLPAESGPPPPAAAASAMILPPATAAAAPVATVPRPPRRPIGRWMRREWFRAATITSPRPPASAEKIAAARAALAAAPDDRKRTRELTRLLALDGALPELDAVVAEWTTRDPLDPDAIAARSDLLARKGHRDDALRVLSGILGTTRGLPAKDEVSLDRTLARAYTRAGKPEACSFWIAAAELSPADVESIARGAACERAQGHARAGDAWLEAAAEGVRAKASPLSRSYETAARSQETLSERAAWGDIVVDASWDDALDLDIVVIDPSGDRVSWSSRSGAVRAETPTSTHHEALALTSYGGGTFMVEIVRASADEAARPVQGRVRISALGGSQSIRNEGAAFARDFVLTGDRVAVARVDVRWDSRLVPTAAPVL